MAVEDRSKQDAHVISELHQVSVVGVRPPVGVGLLAEAVVNPVPCLPWGPELIGEVFALVAQNAQQVDGWLEVC